MVFPGDGSHLEGDISKETVRKRSGEEEEEGGVASWQRRELGREQDTV